MFCLETNFFYIIFMKKDDPYTLAVLRAFLDCLLGVNSFWINFSNLSDALNIYMCVCLCD
jgi:hypothetical protein